MARFTSSVRFPGESAKYRAARDTLLAAERDLRRQVEKVARLRRKLPAGGLVTEDYVFEEGPRDLAADAPATPVRLSELFGAGHDTLVLYSFMYGQGMKQPCPMCTSILDSLDGAEPHITARVNLAIVAKSPVDRIRDFARTRRWTHLRLLSSSKNTYNRDYHGETQNGSQVPSLNVFVRRSGRIHHWYHSELLFAGSDRGQDPRHVDPIWPLWNVLDLTPEGRGTEWYPQLAYEA